MHPRNQNLQVTLSMITGHQRKATISHQHMLQFGPLKRTTWKNFQIQLKERFMKETAIAKTIQTRILRGTLTIYISIHGKPQRTTR